MIRRVTPLLLAVGALALAGCSSESETREETVATQITTTPTEVRPTMAKPGQTVARPTISETLAPQERAFMDELNFHWRGVREKTVLGLGEDVCAQLDSGVNRKVVMQIMTEASDAENAENLMYASPKAYCPQYFTGAK